MLNGQLKLFSGSAHVRLAQEIADYLGAPLGRANLKRFADTEVSFRIDENIRGADVFILQPTCTPVDAHLVELCVMIDAFRRSSAARITAVMPYYGYARQDRKDRPRVPITAKLIGNLIVTAGARRVLSLDLHSNQIQGFFDIPMDHLYSINVFGNYLMEKGMKNLVTVTPDVGNIKMTRAYSELLDAPLAIVDKRRSSGTQTEVLNVIGDVEGKNVVIIDDLISTGGSLVEAATALREQGALDISAVIVHPVLAGPAVERVENSVLTELVVSNSIPVPENVQNGKIKVLSVATILAEAIRRIHNDESVSTLFGNVHVEG